MDFFGDIFPSPTGATDVDVFGGYHSSYHIKGEHWVTNKGTKDLLPLKI